MPPACDDSSLFSPSRPAPLPRLCFLLRPQTLSRLSLCLQASIVRISTHDAFNTTQGGAMHTVRGHTQRVSWYSREGEQVLL